MSDVHDWLLYLGACLLLNMTPGPDTLLIVSRATSMGARAGLTAMAGIIAGCFVHIFAATIGLSALLAASATAFTVIKWVGAAYLIYIGLQLLFSKPVAMGAADTTTFPLRTIFMQGFWSNVLNPKVAVFFLAFIPQFISPASDNKAMAFLVLGCAFNFLSLFWNSFTAIAAARFSQWLKEPRMGLWVNRVGGACFLAFGAKLAVTDK
jgi:threonine/homoserine/homoserine lactone efflux protein